LHVIWQSRPEDNLVFIKIDDGAASYLSPFECRLSYFLYEAVYMLYLLTSAKMHYLKKDIL